ncbi:MAG: tol-pal system-associated acyl-CoA thioesterase [Alphaproteobacteria bacterium]|nr:tol-pal system-associated acyl-CoA thioesterase [Alphaproteobacteria bacterium]
MTEIKCPSGILQNNEFLFPVRVYYEDTDAGGIVYYANYLKFAERARSEFLRYLNINQEKLLKEQGTGFVVRSCNIEYLSSAVLNDDLTVSCLLKELGGASLTVEQKICRGDDILAKIEVKLINLNINKHRPTRISDEIKEKISVFCKD